MVYDSKKQAMWDRLSDRLVILLQQAQEDWKVAAEEIAGLLDQNDPDLSSPQAFVDSLNVPLGHLADTAIKRGFNPRSVTDPLDLVNNLL